MGENVSEALVIRIDLAVIIEEVMSPCLQGMNYGSEFKIMGRIVSSCGRSYREEYGTTC